MYLSGKKKHQEREKQLLIHKRPSHPKRAATVVGYTAFRAVPLQTTETTIYWPWSHCTGSHLVKEKQLMAVARTIGRSWREIGRLALDIPSVKLEQIEEDHSLHVERVFAMLRYWHTCQRGKATAAHLHSLLCQEDWGLAPESIDFLLASA